MMPMTLPPSATLDGATVAAAPPPIPVSEPPSDPSAGCPATEPLVGGLLAEWLPDNDDPDRPAVTLATVDAHGAPTPARSCSASSDRDGVYFHTDAALPQGRPADRPTRRGRSSRAGPTHSAAAGGPWPRRAGRPRRDRPRVRPTVAVPAAAGVGEHAAVAAPTAGRAARPRGSRSTTPTPPSSRPTTWVGFLVRPTSLTFWTGDPTSVSHRREYRLSDGGLDRRRAAPDERKPLSHAHDGPTALPPVRQGRDARRPDRRATPPATRSATSMSRPRCGAASTPPTSTATSPPCCPPTPRRTWRSRTPSSTASRRPEAFATLLARHFVDDVAPGGRCPRGRAGVRVGAGRGRRRGARPHLGPQRPGGAHGLGDRRRGRHHGHRRPPGPHRAEVDGLGVPRLPHGRVHDAAETTDRVLATSLVAQWRYAPGADLDYDATYAAVALRDAHDVRHAALARPAADALAHGRRRARGGPRGGRDPVRRAQQAPLPGGPAALRPREPGRGLLRRRPPVRTHRGGRSSATAPSRTTRPGPVRWVVPR